MSIRKKRGLEASAASVLDRNGLAILVHAHPDAVYIFDLEGTFIECNDNVLTLTGYKKSELLAINFDEIVHDDDAAVTREHFERAARGETARYVTHVTTKTGEQLIVDVTNLPLRDDSGVIVAVMGIARDVGPDRRLQDRIERDEVSRRIAGKLAKFGGWSLEVPSGELFWSEELFGLLKVEPGAAPPFDYAVNMYPDPYRQQLEVALEACMTEGVPIDLESVVRDGQGREFPVHIVAEAVRDDSGTIVRVQGAFQDISDLVADRDERLRLETRLSETLDQITDGIYFFDHDWRFTFVNATGERYVVTAADALLGNVLWDLFPESRDSTFGVAYREAVESRSIRTTRDFYPPLDTWFEATLYPTDDGAALYLRDVTADEQIRAELRAQTLRLQEQAELLDSARDAIVVCRLDDSITYWNRGAETLYGWSAQEAIGVSLTQLLSMDASDVAEARQTALREGQWTGDLKQRSRDGRAIIADARWQFVYDDGEPIAVFGVHSDVTDARQELEHRIRAQRLESLGTLAGGIAHDLNNVLTPILMSVQLLRQLELDAGKRELLHEIENGTKRGADMIRQVLSFAQGVEGERRHVSVTDLLEELLVFCRTTLPSSITVTTESHPDAARWTVEGDPTQLLQVLVNLVTNARDAVRGAGAITIRAHNRTMTSDAVSASWLASVGEFVVLEVSDDGEGIPPDVVSRVFEPFFTTKETGSGTGLGLPMSLSIVQSHGGHLQLDSHEGVGTTVQVLLPQVLAPVDSPRPVDAAAPRGRGERILVIDDEAAIRQIVSKTLSAHGYTVITAGNGREGIELLESLDAPVDLVLTDMQMPVMDGAATVAYLAQHHPDVRLMTASGFAGSKGVSPAEFAREVKHLAKPFTTETLLTAVHSALTLARSESREDE